MSPLSTAPPLKTVPGTLVRVGDLLQLAGGTSDRVVERHGGTFAARVVTESGRSFDFWEHDWVIVGREG
jgi:hypothetical protein